MAQDGTVILSAKDKTAKAFKSANARLKSFGGTITGVQGKLLALAGVAGFGLLISQSLKTNDALAKTADKLGTTTERLAGLQHAAGLSGVENEALNKSLTKMQKAIFDADRGVLTYSQHFDKLGLNTKELMALDPTQQFSAIAEAMNGVGNQTEKTAIAYDVFGGKGTALLNTLALGADGLAKAQEEAEAFGIAISRVDAKQIENANDAMLRAQTALKGVVTRETVELAPFFEAFATSFSDLAKENNGFRDQVLDSLESIIKAVAFLADMWQGLKVTFKLVQVAFSSMAFGIMKVYEKTFTPILNTLAKLPGETGDNFKAASDILTSATKATELQMQDLNAELDELVMQDMPSAKVEAFFNTVRVKAREAAAEAVNAQQEISKTTSPKTPALTQQEQDAAAKLKEQQTEKFNQMIEGHADEMQILFIQEAEKLEFLQESLANRAITEEQYELGKTLTEQKYAEQRMKIAEAEKAAKINAAASLANSIMTISQKGNKAVFEGAQTAAKVIAAVKTGQAAISAFADTPGPIWVKAAAAASAIATGLQQQQQIASVSYGGGGSIGGAGVPGVKGASGQQISTEQAGQLGATEQTAVTKTVTLNLDESSLFRPFVEQLNTTLEDMGSDTRILS